MRCFGSLGEADRVCDLCGLADFDTYRKCKDAARYKKNRFDLIEYVRHNCPKRKKDWDEYTPFYVCKAYVWEVDCDPKPNCLYEFKTEDQAERIFRSYGV